jgi:hypothetical protein
MQDNSESLDISFDFYNEADFMRRIGITPRIISQQNPNPDTNKLVSKLEARKESVTVASQKIFKF